MMTILLARGTQNDQIQIRRDRKQSDGCPGFGGRREGWRLMGAAFQSREMKCVLRTDGGDGRPTNVNVLNATNCSFKVVTMVNDVMRILPQ